MRAPNGASAQAHADVAGALADLLAADVDEWPGRGFDVVKRRTVRRVLRGSLGDVPVHVKVFRADSIAAKARDAARAGKGEREARHLERARAQALPAVEPLAFGTAVLDGQRCSFVVTRTVDAAPFAFPAPDDVAAAAGALVRRVHDLGVEPADLHPGNLLVGADGAPLLCDLTSLRHAGELSLRRRAAGLAFFCNPIDGGALDPVTRAFRRGYEAAGAMPAAFDDELAHAARRLRAAALRSFGRRATRSCRHTEAHPRRRATARWYWHLGHEHLGEDGAALRGACEAFSPEDHAPRREGRRGAVWLTEQIAVKDREPGKARKLWRAAYWLLFADVPTAPPLALCLHRGRGRVFTRRLANDDLRTELEARALSPDDVAAAARALGRALGRLHGHGLRNRDLKFDNLVRDPARGVVCMVDLDGVTLHAADEPRGAGRDLGRLLAAFRAAGSPGGDPTLRRFVAAYARARRRLLQRPPLRRILRRAAERAREWHATHT